METKPGTEIAEVIKKGFSGEKVVDIQRRLKLLGYSLGDRDVDGVFGPETENAVKKFQQDRGLVVSGVVDWETWQELVGAGYKIGDRLLYLKEPPFRGDDVKTLQLWLKTLGFYPYNENGIFCRKTQKAVIEFQRNMNISGDGMVGEETLKCLKSLQRIITSKKSSNFPLISKYGERKRLEKVKVILDYGEEINDIQNGEEYFAEKIYILKSIINFCKEILSENGIKCVVTVGEDESQSLFLFDRINFANKSDGDILISINLNYSVDKDANGCSCFYFKGLKSYSIAGKEIANLIQDKIVKNLGVLDCGVHGANYAILRETTMTSLLVEPGFISNPDEKERLKNTEYQKSISKCISEAILEFLKEGE
ncbi:MAG: peptidoglycan-binding protein [Actinobacteria bacterium]|nr:peptidoglycan-binding protein [Actinomycetota bacterium]